MEPVAISWLVASATSPLIAVLALWTVYVFHTYRKRWRTVDLFLLAVASQELVSAVFTFSYAIVSLINPPITPLCSFVQFGLISVRTFQIATLTSMVVDRALTVRWPYRYRFSVRRNQIRYHIAVLALMSVLVGVAAVFAHDPDNDGGLRCSGHPSEWDIKFVVFVLGFYGVLVLVSLICTVQIEVHKCRNGGKHQSKGMPYQLPDCSSSELPVTTAITSPLDNESHTGSTRTLHRPYRHSSRRPYGKKAGGASDFRWPPVAVVSLVCFSVNHLPYLVLTALATAMPWLWSSWHEAMLSWMRLAEGVLVPLVLCVVDQPVRAALKRTFQRRSGALSPLVGDDGPLHMYFDQDHFRKRGAFGSVTPIGIITNYRRTPGKKRKNRKCKYKLPGLHNGDSIIEKSCLSNNFLSAEPLSKLSCADLTSLEVWQEEDEENFYATLSDDMSTFSCNSTDDNAMNDEAKICDDVYGGSFTTIANDDFEFHDTRPCGGEVRMRPSLTVDIPQNNSFRSSIKGKSTLRDNKHRENEADFVRNENDTNLMNMTFRSDEDKKDPSLFQTMEKKSNDTSKQPDVTKESESENQASTSLVKTKSSWFSMNDLDLIEKTVAEPPENFFVLPVKSESTLSLYRLRLDKHIGELLPVTKSENNINDDSGFGSATQTMNPIWPGYVLPNSSDPSSNLDTNATPPGIGTKKNYPCILHPRMQKLPWISAWKKLGGGNSTGRKDGQEKPHKRLGCQEIDGVYGGGGGVLLINDNFQLRQKDTFHWKESDIYCGETTFKKRHADAQDTNETVVNHLEEESNVLPDIDCILNETSVDDGSAVLRKRDKAEKKRKSRKNSFKDVEQSRPYGRVSDSKQDTVMYSTDASEFNNLGNEENIYEEIVSRTPSDDKNHNEMNVVRPPEDKSYAQTDILKIAVLHEEESQNVKPSFHLDSSERVRDFALNINVGLPDGNEKFRNRSCSDTHVVAPSPSIQNWGLRPVALPPRLNNCNPERRMVFDEGNLPPLPSYNDVNVTYCVNNNLLEFIDNSDFTPDRLQFDLPRRRDAKEDFTANNNKRAADTDQAQPRGQRSSLHRKELLESRHKDSAIRRRESKKDKTNTRSVGTSDIPEGVNSNMVEHYPVVRRQSDSRIRNREVKRRKSSCKESRDTAAVVVRRESGRRSDVNKYDDGYPDCFDARKDVAKVHRKESYNGLWCKDTEYPFARTGENWNGRHVNNPLAVENNRYMEGRVDGYSRVGPAEMMHPAKILHNNNHELSCSTEKINSNDFIRLKCGYGSTTQGNTDIIRSGLVEQEVNRIQVRNSSNVFPNELEEQWIRRRRSELAELCRRESQKDDRRSKSRSHENSDLPEKDNRVKRKSSSTSKDRRAHSDLEPRSEINKAKRIHRQESLNEESKRRNALPNIDDTRYKRPSVVANDINRNESIKLNTESSAVNSNGCSRMDNSVYDRRDNGNFDTETEIFPFETFVKPPPYNLVKYHIAERSGPDQKERVRQKKVAITDYL